MDVQMEREFCSDFKCCDVELSDLHALFDHLGSCHQSSDLCDLPYSVPCPGPSPASQLQTYSAFSEFLHFPMWPSTPPLPPLPHLQKSKPLFTREPLVSPTTSEPSSSSSASNRNLNTRSAHTRDSLYTPVSIPPTLRLDQPKETATSWKISSPSSFYGYYPSPAPNVPLTYAPVPLRPHEQAVTPNVEVIDVDSISSPSARVMSLPTESEPLPVATPTPAAPQYSARSPSPSPPPTLEVTPAAVESARPRPAAEEPPAKRHCPSNVSPRAPTSAFLAALRRRFFVRPGTPRKATAPSSAGGAALDPPTDTLETIDAAASSSVEAAMEVETDAEGDALEESEVRGGCGETLEIMPETEVVRTTNEPVEKMTEDPKLDSQHSVAEVFRDSDSTPVAHVPADLNPTVYGEKKTKPFVCPVPGCIKTYMTLNGFRYHEQKGTCITEDGTLVQVVTRTVPVVAIATTVSPAATTSPVPKKTKKTKPQRRCPSRHSARLVSSAGKTVATRSVPEPRRSVSSAPSSDDSDSDSE
ncbi:hypothetical protein DFH09DRAFT_1282132 [Mycena vulgaris]|nr:hypothetical protein DFH09DRAFT_1282132 [Mycena vulgaris]